MAAEDSTNIKCARSRRKSFTEALKEKYCTRENWDTRDLIHVKIIVTGKPKNRGTAELGFLTNVVLNGSHVSHAGLPKNGLSSLCPNVVDLDLSNNLIGSWDEVLPIMVQLPHLQFVNLSKNKLGNRQFLTSWKRSLPSIQNLVLNNTEITWVEAACLCGFMTGLRELHVCKNGYSKIEVEHLDMMHNVQCLRLNDNRFTRWQEIWKLRYLQNLSTLVLSGNPLLDIFYRTEKYDPENVRCTCENTHKQCEDEKLGYAAHVRLTESFERGWNFPSPKNSPRKRNTSEDSDVSEEGDVSEDGDIGHDIIDDVCDNDHDCAVNVNDCDDFVNDVMRKVIDNLLVSDSSDVTDKTRDVIHSNQSQNYQNDSGISMTSDRTPEVSLDETNGDTSLVSCPYCSKQSQPIGFAKLSTLCVSDTLLSNWSDLEALDQFPKLTGIRMKDISLMSHVNMEDRRKLFIACLSKVSSLNGSEVTDAERDKAERHFLREFCDKARKPNRYQVLESIHGVVKPLVELDLSYGYKENVSVLLFYKGIELGPETINLRDSVDKLRVYVAGKVRKPATSIEMYHVALSETTPVKQQLRLYNLPLSRYELRDGDEIHVEDKNCGTDVCG